MKFGFSRFFLIDAAMHPLIGASHSEAAIAKKQPPREPARRLNLYRGNADFSNSAP